MPVSQLDEKAALVVIDLQKGLVGLPGLTAVHDVVARSARLAEAFRARSLPVVMVTVTGAAQGRTETTRPRMELPPGWDELVPELGLHSEDILIRKQRPGAFSGQHSMESCRSAALRRYSLRA